MRPHSRFNVDRDDPSARGVCDRCGFMYQHDTLKWQFQWQGAKLQNIRVLVCDRCLDVPQEQLRTIILPQDPVPIKNPRPENYTSDNAPLSSIPTSIGSLTQWGGVAAAFDSTINKPANFCAAAVPSVSGYENYLGKNWGSDNTQTIREFFIYAPNDTAFSPVGALNYKLQSSDDGETWTDTYTGSTDGSVAEAINITPNSGPNSQYHRIAFEGDGVNQITVAQIQFYVVGSYPEGDQ